MNHEYLLKALRLLNVDGLRSFGFYRRTSLPWAQFPPEPTRGILRIFQAPSLVNLELWEVPRSFLDACTSSLRSLCLYHTTTDSLPNAVNPTSVTRTSPIVLKSLIFQDGNFNALVKEGNKISSKELEYLQVKGARPEFHLRIPQLIRLCSQTLRSLDIKPCLTYNSLDGGSQGR